MITLGGLLRLPVVLYCGELIFEYKYLCEYDAKIKNIYTLVCGPQDVLLGMKNSKNRVCWTVLGQDLNPDPKESLNLYSELF